MIILRTYCFVGRRYFGLWLRLHPNNWKIFYLPGPRWGGTVQVGPVNVRIGESWNILNR